ncbi:MAG: AMP-binding protein [Deltaproteobacteria bacterium]|nr:AMP-binding protein [Deltaproteobacteria bacterium]MBW2086257.1 AMP-binding protein [Deltaproteobacteria bacterium]
MAKNFKAWPKDWPKKLNYPQIPVYGFLDQTARRNLNRIAIIYEGLELTYGELKELSDRFGAALKELGVGKGSVVAVHLPNCPQFAMAYYGLLKSGAVFTPLSPLLAPREVAFQLNDSGAETLITLDRQYSEIESVLPATGIKRVITASLADRHGFLKAPVKEMEKIETPGAFDMASLLKDHESSPGDDSIDGMKDLAHISYTGGTTGFPKGVMLRHSNVVANSIQVAHWLNGAQVEMKDGVLEMVFPPGVDPEKDRLTIRDRETALVVSPWYHALGTIRYLNNLVYTGATMVVFRRFDPKEYLEAIVKYQVTILGGAPQLYIPLVNHLDFKSYDLSCVKFAASGAAPLPVPILEKMLEAFSGVVCEAYGLTECTMGATANPPDRSAIRIGSVGLPTFDTELKVIDLATGEDLPPGREGEVCIKGPQVMLGYLNQPEETVNVLKDGWLLTGDIGREDEDGFFYITGRKKDMIIYKGYNIYPREIEELIFEHPAVSQCAVVGKPDEKAGEIPVAFVELKEGAPATAEEIMEYTNAQIAAYKKIRKVIFMDHIPVSGPGKVLKTVLRERLKDE